MPPIRPLSTALALIFSLFGSTFAAHAETPSLAPAPENTIHLYLKSGMVSIRLFPQIAPNHVARIKELTREGYYNGKLWHRVIDGFMAQTGSPNGDGQGGSTKPDLQAEFNNLSHIRGTVSMARTMDPNSANAQFFIMLAPNPGLDGQYTAFGQVISGMEHIDQIKKGDPYNNGMVTGPDKIVKMALATDDTKAKK